MKRLSERDPLEDDERRSHPSKRPRYDQDEKDKRRHARPSAGAQWRVPDSHATMPHIIRKEVREFHQINVHVSEPPKVKLTQTHQSEDSKEEENQPRRSNFCDSTFNKEHDFKVPPPIPSFKSMMFHQDVIDCLRNKFEIEEPTTFQIQAIPILLEERSMIAKGSPNCGKTLTYVLTGLMKAYQHVGE